MTDELKAQGYELANRQDVEALYIQLTSLSKEKLSELAKNKDQPIIVQIVARELLEGDDPFSTIERILDRAVGKATQKTESTVETKIDMVTPVKEMTTEQLEQAITT